MSRIPWLHDDPSSPFPHPDQALTDPPGLLAVGGDLSVTRLLNAYGHGIFPWYEDGQPILWWSPDPRAVFRADHMIVSRSLRRTWRRSGWRISFDEAFWQVMQACAASVPGRERTWITADMQQGYQRLHEHGHAHSIEVWEESGELIGGLYGVSIGGAFFGESMFSRRSDASKIALICIVAHAASWGYGLFDCQMPTPHLLSMGAESVSRSQYLQQLRLALKREPDYLGRRPWAVVPEILQTMLGSERLNTL